MAWLDTDFEHRVKITVAATQVDADLTDFPVYVNLNNLPAEFHTNVNQTDARDIRVTLSDEVTEVPREVVFYTAASDTGELYFKAVGTLSSTVDSEYYIYYSNAGASEPAADATYGSQNVWSDYEGVYHMDDASATIADSTAGGKTMTDNAGGTTYDVTGKIGKAIDFSGGLFSIAEALVTAAPFTLQAWSEPDSANSNISLVGVGDTDANENATIRHALSAATVAQTRTAAGFQSATAATTYSADVWTLVHGVFAASNNRIVYLDGGNSGNNTADVTASGYDLTMVGARANGTGQLVFNGAIDEVRIRASALSADWVDAEYTNMHTPLTFYAVGAEEDAPSAGATFTPKIMWWI